jgi:hypothetical protein
LLVAGAVLAWLTGVMLVLALPAPAALRAALALLFTASCWLELHAQCRGMARIDRIRITAGGRIEGTGPGGERLPLELLAGSMLLSRRAWLRLKFPDGTVSGEWLEAGRGESEQWRMLQLIWRQSWGRLGRRL